MQCSEGNEVRATHAQYRGVLPVHAVQWGGEGIRMQVPAGGATCACSAARDGIQPIGLCPALVQPLWVWPTLCVALNHLEVGQA